MSVNTHTNPPQVRPKPPVNYRRTFSVRDQLLHKLGTDGYSRLVVALRDRAS